MNGSNHPCSDLEQVFSTCKNDTDYDVKQRNLASTLPPEWKSRAQRGTDCMDYDSVTPLGDQIVDGVVFSFCGYISLYGHKVELWQCLQCQHILCFQHTQQPTLMEHIHEENRRVHLQCWCKALRSGSLRIET